MKKQCPVCKSINVRITRITNLKAYKDNEYDLNHCNECSMEFWTPLELIPEIYSNEYLENYKDIHSGDSEIGINMKLFLNNPENGRGCLVDVGCGNGLFINELKKKSFTVFGIDLDNISVEYCKEINLEVFNLNLDDFMIQYPDYENKFDYVTFFEVLEHQDNPKRFLLNVKRLLKDKGKIAFSVPDREKITTKMFKIYSLFSDPNNLLKITKRDFPPHHFLWFNKKVLHYLLVDTGFTDIRFYSITNTKDGRVTTLKSAMGHLSTRLNTIVPDLFYRILSTLPLGWNYSIYCEAKLRNS